MSMKTAEEWRKHFKVWAEEWASDKEIKTIQLDAFKAGAEWAASKVAIYDNPNDTWGGGLLFGRASSIRREISNLKEIPK